MLQFMSANDWHSCYRPLFLEQEKEEGWWCRKCVTLIWKCILKKLMNDFTDSNEELTVIEVLFEELSDLGSPSIQKLIWPNYHCEISCEDVMLALFFQKKIPKYSIFIEENQRRSRVKQSIENITKEHTRKLSGRWRNYMMSYMKTNVDDRSISPSKKM